MERVEDRGTAPQPDSAAPLEGPSGPVETESHRRIAVLSARNSLVNGEVGLVHYLGEDPAKDEARPALENALDMLAHRRERSAGRGES